MFNHSPSATLLKSRCASKTLVPLQQTHPLPTPPSLKRPPGAAVPAVRRCAARAAPPFPAFFFLFCFCLLWSRRRLGLGLVLEVRRRLLGLRCCPPGWVVGALPLAVGLNELRPRFGDVLLSLCPFVDLAGAGLTVTSCPCRICRCV